MTQPNRYAPPVAKVADIHTENTLPRLWNPGAAAGCSLLFTTVFGAYLHMENWRALGQIEKANVSRNWLTGYVIYLLAAVLAPLLSNDSAALNNII